MLHVNDLIKRYINENGEAKGGISGVSFDVKEGELFTLLGPSGCGKTTTLRSIAGLERPDSGTIRLGTNVLFQGDKGIQVPMYHRDIGMVFQSYAIWPHMNVFDNAAYPLRTRRAQRPARADLERRVMRALEMVGLAEFRDRSATKLSGGQQQRLALARALVREPKLLLLDEPLSNLDALLREQMRSEIKRLQEEWGVTTIYVTHDQSEAMALSDRVAVLNNSQIVQIGAPDDIYDRPESEFVAGFIGRTNKFRGRVTAPVAVGEFGQVTSPLGAFLCQFSQSAAAGEQVTFVIRPENIDVRAQSAQSTGAVGNEVRGRVQGRVFLGEITEYSIALDAGEMLIARLHPAKVFAPGEIVTATLTPRNLIAMTR